MPTDGLSAAALGHALEAEGLRLCGGFHPTAEDAVPALPDGKSAGTLLVVGQAGGRMWERLQAAPEALGPDPVDRWTARVIGLIAAGHGAAALFPFGGPPYHPFQRWARRAEPELAPSPIGLLIHPEFGLWHALRGALLFAERLALPARGACASPCDACATKPCLTACPVGAFTAGGYDVGACRTLLGTLSGQACMTTGCLARNACPVGRGWRYPSAEVQHHMRAFRRG